MRNLELKNCNKCGVVLIKDINWTKWAQKSRTYTCYTCCNSAAQRRRKKYTKEQIKNWHLSSKYNLSLKDYMLMYELQKGKCKICNVQKDTLNVDHCHDTGKVRGLLCSNCNKGIGMLKHNINNFIRAINYLK